MLSIFRYVVAVSSDVKAVLKIDADISWKIRHLIQFINYAVSPQKAVFYCHRNVHGKPARSSKVGYKWVVDEKEYPGDDYPTFCLGWCYIATVPALDYILYNVPSKRFFWLEDVFITGILNCEKGASIVNMGTKRFFRNKTPLSSFEDANSVNHVLAEEASVTVTFPLTIFFPLLAICAQKKSRRVAKSLKQNFVPAANRTVGMDSGSVSSPNQNETKIKTPAKGRTETPKPEPEAPPAVDPNIQLLALAEQQQQETPKPEPEAPPAVDPNIQLLALAEQQQQDSGGGYEDFGPPPEEVQPRKRITFRKLGTALLPEKKKAKAAEKKRSHDQVVVYKGHKKKKAGGAVDATQEDATVGDA
ncbi:unnamed protein product [Nippostrongylus brasiliensis]|uniref:Hexosyltransferase n=1 Tax=Nippostrongylus brasiliensis TaxID=27835 RepID=A0A158R1W7_NIPBR|nr:unnamed protein product [Nippostrongylus brasiliensis]